MKEYIKALLYTQLSKSFWSNVYLIVGNCLWKWSNFVPVLVRCKNFCSAVVWCIAENIKNKNKWEFILKVVIQFKILIKCFRNKIWYPSKSQLFSKYIIWCYTMVVWLNHKISKNDEQRTMNISLGDKECHWWYHITPLKSLNDYIVCLNVYYFFE